MRFYENPYSRSRVVSCGRTDGQTYVTKLIVAFRQFANVIINISVQVCSYFRIVHLLNTAVLLYRVMNLSLYIILYIQVIKVNFFFN